MVVFLLQYLGQIINLPTGNVTCKYPVPYETPVSQRVHPAKAGDTITIDCTGLGQTSAAGRAHRRGE
jgi:hypothetical protein